MIEGFDRETQPLTEDEMRMVPKIILGMRNKVGKARAITSTNICKGMKANGYDLNDSRLRKIMNHIRINNLLPCICGSGKGYYIAGDREEMENYIRSLTGRLQAMVALRNSMEQQMRSCF